jgi:hypothetical protein
MGATLRPGGMAAKSARVQHKAQPAPPKGLRRCRSRSRNRLQEELERQRETGRASLWCLTSPCTSFGRAVREWGPWWHTYLTHAQTVPRFLHVLMPDETDVPEQLTPVELGLEELRAQVATLGKQAETHTQKIMGSLGREKE